VAEDEARSSGFFGLEKIIDIEVLLDELQAAGESMRGVLGREALEAAMADTVVLTEVAIDGLEAVVGLAGDDVGFLSFGVAFPADDAFVSEAGADVVEGCAAGDDFTAIAFMLGEHGGDGAVVSIEELGEVAVGKESSLLVSLVAEPDSLVQQALGGGDALDAVLHVIVRAEIEEHGNEVGVDDALLMSWRVIDADGHPEDLAVGDVVLRAQMLKESFENHVCAELTDAWPADAGELFGDAMREGVFECFPAKGSEFLADEVRLSAHGRPPFEGLAFFSAPQAPSLRSSSRW